jgi:UDP-N-acetylglucosamine--N-acetylmuramyl-(pentapeptide) pyrophosphoryl-undecaprenol N-acetylglucosamine transferase
MRVRNYKIIISGGGTGGHLFPALSIANEIKHRFPDADILFVGAENRMEMERVPAAGYRIIGLPVYGFNRKNLLKNFNVVIRLMKSLRIAKKIIRDFKPDIAIGVGGYASGPTLWMASSLRIPVLIQEQNSYAGVTNRLLGKRATKICVAYKGMDKYFPEDRIVITGNPVRKELELIREKDAESLRYFGMEPGKPILLVLGGSLGAGTINRSILMGFNRLIDTGVQIIWQTGRSYYESVLSELNCAYYVGLLKESTIDSIKKETNAVTYKNLWVSDFITRMDYAYAVADLVVSRAGAGTLSELALLKKAALLVPSPNVAEDHQTKNARTLSDSNAAVLIPDKEAEEILTRTAIILLKNKERLRALSENIAHFAQHDSAKRIVDEIVTIIEKKKL